MRELAAQGPAAGCCSTASDPGNDLHPLGEIEALPEASRFRVRDAEAGEVEIDLPLAGGHNVSNALAVWAAARRDGIPAAKVAAAFARFPASSAAWRSWARPAG